MNQTWVNMCSISGTPSNLPLHPLPQSHPSAPALSMSYASNLDWWSISQMVIHIFQCYSPKSSHPHLLPQSPEVCSLYLCLFSCLTYRVIIAVFLTFIYIYVNIIYCICVFFLNYFTMYNRLQF